MKEYKINGYVVKSWYAGLDNYCVLDGDKEIGVCWSIADVAAMVGVDAETVKNEMWRQR